MALKIPTEFDFPAFNMTTTLDNVVYDLRFDLNGRDGFWRMDIGRDGTVLVANIKIVLSLDLLKAHRNIPELPQGILAVIDKLGQHTEPNEQNFGDSVVLTYEPVV